MPKFYSIQEFRTALKRLCSKTKEGYSGVREDICKSFMNKPINEIRSNRDMVLDEDMFTIVKLRVPNNRLKLSKQNGFRLIYLVHKKEEKVTFLYVYPKRGAQGIETIGDGYLKKLLKDFIEESKGSTLVSHKIEDDLKEDYEAEAMLSVELEETIKPE